MNLSQILLLESREPRLRLEEKVKFTEQYYYEIMMLLMFFLGAVFILCCFMFIPANEGWMLYGL